MADPCVKQVEHSHVHGPNCGHTAVRHDGHTDYLHNGHLHHVHGNHTDEHKLGEGNQDLCTPDHKCGAHPADHVHGPNCGHEAVLHGNHTDYLVAGHLHHPHGRHCDDHGRWNVRRNFSLLRISAEFRTPAFGSAIVWT